MNFIKDKSIKNKEDLINIANIIYENKLYDDFNESIIIELIDSIKNEREVLKSIENQKELLKNENGFDDSVLLLSYAAFKRKEIEGEEKKRRKVWLKDKKN